MESIIIHDKKFRLTIPGGKIQNVVHNLALQLNTELHQDDIIFIAILNGSFMFASDLLKKIKLNCRISFVKMASYDGTENTGQINQLIGINEVLNDKTVVLIEDIVDSGNTLENIIDLYRLFFGIELKQLSRKEKHSF